MEKNKIYNMDCIQGMKTLPDKSIDMIFTDPPYKLIAGGCKKSKLRGHLLNKSSVFTTQGSVFNTPKYNDWISEYARVLKPDSYCFIMTNDLNIPEFIETANKNGFKFCELLVMRKQNKVPSLYFFKQCEFILMFRNGKYKKFNKYGHSNIFDVILPKGKKKLCPTEKTPDFIEEIIKVCSNENDLIMDSFMGSGTTAIASLNTNRNYIGFELDENYFISSINRITNHTIINN